MIYTLTINPALDKELKIISFDYEDVNRVRSSKTIAGGKGINVSRILKYLEVENKAIILSGGKNGKKLKNLLNKEKILYNNIEIKGETRENLLILDKKNKELRINEKGASLLENEKAEIFKSLELLKEEDYLVLAGSLAKNMDNDFYSKIIKSLKNKKIKVILDADGEALKKGVLEKPFMIKPNWQELERFFNRKILKIEEVLDEIIKLNIEIVVITNADKDLSLIYKGELSYYKIKKVKIENSLGAGDSFIAGFLSEYVENNIKDSILKGIDISAKKVSGEI